jgi:hypothetical protein
MVGPSLASIDRSVKRSPGFMENEQPQSRGGMARDNLATSRD